MKFWDCFYYLCNQKQTKPNIVAKELNISSATVTGWKQGSPPNSERLVAIADYFGVTTDYLLGRSGTDPELPEDEIELLQNYRKSDEKMKKLIRKMAEEAADQEPDQIKRQA